MAGPLSAKLLDRLAPDQRAAATASLGPVLCVAPAGSGKTTTLVARIAWLIDQGTPADSICAITFNKRAAEELGTRLEGALGGVGLGAPDARVRVQPFMRWGARSCSMGVLVSSRCSTGWRSYAACFLTLARPAGGDSTTRSRG